MSSFFFRGKQLVFYVLMTMSYVLSWPFFFLALFLPRAYGFFVFRWCSRYFIAMGKIFFHISWCQEGSFPTKKPFLLVSKHQSMWETVWFLAYGPSPVFLLKKNLFYIPFLGWALWALGMIPVHRKNKKSNKGIEEEVKKNIYTQGCLVLFPEGTRYAPGHRGKYRPGVFFIAKTLDLPLVPVALNTGLCWTRSFFKKPGVITLKILPPLEPETFRLWDRKTFLKTLENLMDDASEALIETSSLGQENHKIHKTHEVNLQ